MALTMQLYPPVEAEANYHRHLANQAPLCSGLHDTRGGSLEVLRGIERTIGS